MTRLAAEDGVVREHRLQRVEPAGPRRGHHVDDPGPCGVNSTCRSYVTPGISVRAPPSRTARKRPRTARGSGLFEARPCPKLAILHGALRATRIHVTGVHRAALAHEGEHRLRAFVPRGRPQRRDRARMHQPPERARHEAVVDEHVLLDGKRCVEALEIASTIAGDARPERQILRTRRRADRTACTKPRVSIARSSVVGVPRLRLTAKRRRSLSVMMRSAGPAQTLVYSNLRAVTGSRRDARRAGR